MTDVSRHAFVRRSAVSFAGLVWWAGVTSDATAAAATSKVPPGFTPQRQAAYAAFVDAVATNPANEVGATGQDAIAVFKAAYDQQPQDVRDAIDRAIDQLNAYAGPGGTTRLSVDQRVTQLRAWTSVDAPPVRPTPGELPAPSGFDEIRTHLMAGARGAYRMAFVDRTMPAPPKADGPPRGLAKPNVEARFNSPWLEQKLAAAKQPSSPTPAQLRSALVHAALLTVPVPAEAAKYGVHRLPIRVP
jgi:hypothetical protein